jgi:4-amino-4-deoxy-L-arabinose transferase-like glycosyltransferase
MQKWKQWALLCLILITALALRWTGIDWDGYHHYHPDERYITWVATTIEWPADLSQALNPTQSSLNPFYWHPEAASDGIEVLQDEPRNFAYGHVPLYLGVFATRVVERIGAGAQGFLSPDWLVTTDILNARLANEFRHLTAVSRALTGLVDAATVLLIFLIGRRLFNWAVGLLAGAFLALNVMHIQLSHFFTADPYLTFFGIGALYFMIRAVYSADALRGVKREARQRRCSPMCNLIIAAVFVGLAIGAKFSASLMLLPLVAALWFVLPPPRFWRFFVVLGTTLLTFAISNPFAILDFNCQVVIPAVVLGPVQLPALDLSSCYLANIFSQGSMVRGRSDLGFTRQYDGTLPYLYPIEMQLRWGMGWPLGLVAFTAFVWIIWITARPLWQRWRRVEKDLTEPLPPLTLSLLILLIWAVPFFVTTGGFYVKFMRYLQPLTPLLMLFSAAFILQVRDRRFRLAVLLLVLLPTALYALGFMNIYRSDHPWVEASRWVYANVPPQTLIASEQWDDSLPATMLIDGQVRQRGEYLDQQLTWLTDPDAADNEAKLERNLSILEEAEYVTLLSNRVYGVVPRTADRYPLSHVYHQMLFDGTLGFEPIYANTRMPGLFSLHILPDSFVWPDLEPPLEVGDYLQEFPGFNGGRFDESFTVYDQPLVMIFKKVTPKTAEEMRQYFPNP